MSKLVYYSEAKKWNQALPLGNGETALMACGGVSREKLYVNNANLWSGYPKSDDRDCTQSLKEVRSAIFGKRYKEANNLARGLEGDYSQAYMPLGEIDIKYSGVDTSLYMRELDLDKAIFNVRCGSMQRTAFVSHPDKVAVYHSQSSTEFDITIKLSSKLKSQTFTQDNNLVLCGNAPDYAAPNYLWTKFRPIRYNQGKAMAFAMAITAQTDGQLSMKSGSLCVINATFVDIFVVTHTGFKGYDKMPCVDTKTISRQCIDLLGNVDKKYARLLNRHLEDYKSLYSRHKLTLSQQDVDVLGMLQSVNEGGSPTALINLLYNYGKYMTIAGSRDGQPLNLQGQWNNSIRPPWSSNLTTNINFEMNYWGTAAANLAPCLEPFYTAAQEICNNGKKTAQINYNARGFACNHNVDIWRKTSPVKGTPSYMYAPMCGVWLANEVYNHKMTLGHAINNETKELLRNAALFCIDYLVEYEGQYVTCPSASPEAEFMHNGSRCSLGYGSAYEMSLVKQCFDNCLSIDINEALNEEILAKKAKLYSFVETSTGINEWHTDLPIIEKGHRHFSPLYGLYPGDVVAKGDNPKDLELATKLFDYRISNSNTSVGWSGAWAICIAARLNDGQKVEKLILGLINKSIMPNLFGFHPPNYFQIDCNMGFVAAINEILVSSVADKIVLLSACPSYMKDGSVSGHVVRGAEISFVWKDWKVTEISSNKSIVVEDKNIAVNVKLTNVIIKGRNYGNI